MTAVETEFRTSISDQSSGICSHWMNKRVDYCPDRLTSLISNERETHHHIERVVKKTNGLSTRRRLVHGQFQRSSLLTWQLEFDIHGNSVSIGGDDGRLPEKN